MEITAETHAREIHWGYRIRRWVGAFIPHLVLAGYSIIALFPIFLILINNVHVITTLQQKLLY